MHIYKNTCLKIIKIAPIICGQRTFLPTMGSMFSYIFQQSYHPWDRAMKPQRLSTKVGSLFLTHNKSNSQTKLIGLLIITIFPNSSSSLPLSFLAQGTGYPYLLCSPLRCTQSPPMLYYGLARRSICLESKKNSIVLQCLLLTIPKIQ